MRYFAVEGVKGSGKSTVVKQICEALAEEQHSIRLIGPTRPCSGFSILESTSAFFPFLRKSDIWNELLYARRSAYAASCMKGDDSIYIGDRSIVTSYVARWNRWNDPEKTIRRVDLIEPFLPAPDVIFYLSVTAEEALRRIAARGVRTYGLEDQTPERISAAINAYNQICSKDLPRLRNTFWQTVDAHAPAQEVACLILEKIKYYLQFANNEERNCHNENYIYN